MKTRSPIFAEFARRMHDEYERAAAESGWKTQGSCRGKPWAELPRENQETMILAAERALRSLMEVPRDLRESRVGVTLWFPLPAEPAELAADASGGS
jgi:hypothetical protein